VRLVKKTRVEGKREELKNPKKRWLDVIENGTKKAGVSVENAGDRVKWTSVAE